MLSCTHLLQSTTCCAATGKLTAVPRAPVIMVIQPESVNAAASTAVVEYHLQPYARLANQLVAVKGAEHLSMLGAAGDDLMTAISADTDQYFSQDQDALHTNLRSVFGDVIVSASSVKGSDVSSMDSPRADTAMPATVSDINTSVRNSQPADIDTTVAASQPADLTGPACSPLAVDISTVDSHTTESDDVTEGQLESPAHPLAMPAAAGEHTAAEQGTQTGQSGSDAPVVQNPQQAFAAIIAEVLGDKLNSDEHWQQQALLLPGRAEQVHATDAKLRAHLLSEYRFWHDFLIECQVSVKFHCTFRSLQDPQHVACTPAYSKAMLQYCVVTMACSECCLVL